MEQRLGDMELRFAELIWAKAPVASGVLVALCAESFNWKKSTTYTMLKRLCKRGIFKNQDGLVQAVIGREEFYGIWSEQFVTSTFNGSLPGFVAAFTKRKKLSRDEIAELRQMIDGFEVE